MQEIIKIDMPQDVVEIIQSLCSHGFSAYAVGGCVRDTLLGVEPKDWDITTSASPVEVKEIFGHTLDTGIEHGTVTIMRGKIGYEVTTYRIDGKYSDGRHPDQVKFTPNLFEDLRRRDFTINAMAYSDETGLVDEFCGMEDLEKKVVRCVGEAKERFQEDALRMLRAIRFSAQLGFTIESDTWQAMIQMAKNLSLVSKERILVELTKTICSSHPEMVKKIFDSGLHKEIGQHFSLLSARDAEVMALSGQLPEEKHLRFALLFKNQSGEEAKAILKELKADNDTIKKVKILVEYIDRKLPRNEKKMRQTLSEIGPERVRDWILLKKVLGEEVEDCQNRLQEILERGDAYTLQMLAVDGATLIRAGIKPGPNLGQILGELLSYVIEDPSKNTMMFLLEKVKEICYNQSCKIDQC
jgi:polynucleotide adenylyltransferase region